MKKRKLLVLAAAMALPCGLLAQKKGFDYKFYGQVRADMFYNSRTSSETVDGLFYMYPLDERPDADGKDLNDRGLGNFHMLYSRVGMDVAGPEIGRHIKPSAKLEVDFRGSGTTYSMIRIRHAYFNLDFQRGSSLLVGQTWHPLYGDVAPDILNLNMGAPYQPFSRAPQLRYRLDKQNFRLTAAALWQSQYTAVGPSSDVAGVTTTAKSHEYLKNGVVPEFYAGLDYKRPGLLAGVGVELFSMVPRTESLQTDATTQKENVYRVDERITSLSYEAHVKYTHRDWLFAAKSVLGSNLTQTSTVGGYGITSIDERTGAQEYAPLRVSHTWVNVMYGKRWRGGIFAGYLKNLGATEELMQENGKSLLLGTGTNLDQLATATAELTYNLPNWKFGLEYSYCTAWYGTNDVRGKVTDTHSVDNHRLVLTALFQF